MTASYYKGAHGILIVYDITDRETFDNVREWIREIERYSRDNICKILVGNKSDMEDKRQVSREDGEELAAHYQMPFIETSAKNSLNVDDAFIKMTKEIKDKNMNDVAKKGQPVGGSTFGMGRSLTKEETEAAQDIEKI